MIDAERMLGSLVRNAMSGRGGLSGGGRHRGRRRRGRRGGSMLGSAGKGALALGALGVAIAAFEHFGEKKAAPSRNAGAGAIPPPPPPVPHEAASDLPPLPPLPTAETTAAPPPATETGQSEALLLVRAMIAAANADHELDDEERWRILQALAEADASEEDKAFVRRQLEEPIDLATLAASATSPELASQIYLASCLAIEIDTRAERNYLDRLSNRLGLDTERTRELEGMLASEKADETES